MGIEINDLESKGYETLIYKKRDNVWEEKIYSYYSIDSISLNVSLKLHSAITLYQFE